MCDSSFAATRLRLNKSRLVRVKKPPPPVTALSERHRGSMAAEAALRNADLINYNFLLRLRQGYGAFRFYPIIKGSHCLVAHLRRNIFAIN